MKITELLNLSNEIYHNSEDYRDYWSSSNLKEYMVSPREAYYQKFHAEHSNSDALVFGSQLHDFLASKHVNGQPFNWNVFEPPINPTTKESFGKTTKAYAEALARVENPISSIDMEIINDIWSMILNSDYAWYFQKYILGTGIAEPSYFLECGMHKYKYRPDVLTDKAIFDYKTINKSLWNEKSIKYRIVDFGYDISAAMYQYFEHQRTGIWKPFFIVWIMKEPPFDILVQDISTFCYEPIKGGECIVNSGAMAFKKIKDQHELCQITGKWPGLANRYEKFNGVRIPEFTASYENSFDPFEIEEDSF